MKLKEILNELDGFEKKSLKRRNKTDDTGDVLADKSKKDSAREENLVKLIASKLESKFKQLQTNTIKNNPLVSFGASTKIEVDDNDAPDNIKLMFTLGVYNTLISICMIVTKSSIRSIVGYDLEDMDETALLSYKEYFNNSIKTVDSSSATALLMKAYKVFNNVCQEDYDLY